MPAVSGRALRIDWTDKDAVIALAKQLGPGMTVFKLWGRENFNITHTERRDQWDRRTATVIHRT